jgi:hypothetical protein
MVIACHIIGSPVMIDMKCESSGVLMLFPRVVKDAAQRSKSVITILSADITAAEKKSHTMD